MFLSSTLAAKSFRDLRRSLRNLDQGSRALSSVRTDNPSDIVLWCLFLEMLIVGVTVNLGVGVSVRVNFRVSFRVSIKVNVSVSVVVCSIGFSS